MLKDSHFGKGASMETREHTELGNMLRFTKINNNPYLRIDEKGTLYLTLQRHHEGALPEPMKLEMSAGEIVAMAGDYFTDRDWNMKLDLPSNHSFETAQLFSNNNARCELGDYLIDQPVSPEEENAFIGAYNNLAAPNVSRANIDLIYKIDKSTYFPFSTAFNDYIKQLMFYLRVKDYGEMLNRNQTHFTPWSVRVYSLGHHLALRYAHLAYELSQLIADPNYSSSNEELHNLVNLLKNKPDGLSTKNLQDMFHRYQALSYCMELFVFHYYSDHFAAGHMSMVGDLRILLGQRFGTLGNILANNLHNELNHVGVYTRRPYDPTPNSMEAPTHARGDGDFDSCVNHFNKEACLAGMQASFSDLEQVMEGKTIPNPRHYGGLEHLPDVDYCYRQPQPLLVLGEDTKIYCRENLRHIKILSPSEHAKLRVSPTQCGYREIKNKWDAFWLVTKLRVFPSIYTGQLQPLSPSDKLRIEEEERQLNPHRDPIPVPPCTPEQSHVSKNTQEQFIDWRSPVNQQMAKKLNDFGLLATQPQNESSKEEIEEVPHP